MIGKPIRRRAGSAPTLLAFFALGGCASLGGNIAGSFSCPAPDGVCAPASAIDDRALAMRGTASFRPGPMRHRRAMSRPARSVAPHWRPPTRVSPPSGRPERPKRCFASSSSPMSMSAAASTRQARSMPSSNRANGRSRPVRTRPYFRRQDLLLREPAANPSATRLREMMPPQSARSCLILQP